MGGGGSEREDGLDQTVASCNLIRGELSEELSEASYQEERVIRSKLSGASYQEKGVISKFISSVIRRVVNSVIRKRKLSGDLCIRIVISSVIRRVISSVIRKRELSVALSVESSVALSV